ncbi:hypothetical protein P3H15_11305 [Rhodococcus sp. T2V]|uniref:hypothetical protein n=1 Tax=Rhodococcus sp. T2V TaxID=3034164 RepID=UPI0023E17A36|nr:hypothetical protein [Rhodococcus sp. T2V]MDF3305607.1 hypothetical protein [Rhodococcus sp. T2V]
MTTQFMAGRVLQCRADHCGNGTRADDRLCADCRRERALAAEAALAADDEWVTRPTAEPISGRSVDLGPESGGSR